MPYIKKERRIHFKAILSDVNIVINRNTVPGDLNFLVTSIIRQYINAQGESYTAYNDVLGVLEAAKLEFYRRSVIRFEEKALKENGDL